MEKGSVVEVFGNLQLEKGIKKGREEGREEGWEEGIVAEKIEIAKKLLKKNFEIKLIQEVTNLTNKEIEALK